MAFGVLLSLAVANCSSKRSFSYLKRLKSHQRSLLIEENLNPLAFLTVEADLTGSLQFDDIIDEVGRAYERYIPFFVILP